jgi:hypothetical protein
VLSRRKLVGVFVGHRQGRVRISRVVVALAIVCSLGVASGVAVAGTNLISAVLGGPGKEQHSCDPEHERQAEKGRYYEEPLCGSRWNDRLTASKYGGHHMRGYQGDDVFRARNGQADEINGDPGHDTAYVDSSDKVVGVEVCKPIQACRNVRVRTTTVARRPTKRGADELRYPAYLSRTECRVREDGRREIWFISEPLLRAVDSTPRVDWQTVAWSPVLYKLEGSQWVEVLEHVWLWSRTNDTAPPDRLHQNWWRSFTGAKERAMIWFEPSAPGTYQVRLRLYWYKTARVPAYLFEDDEESVDPHYGKWGYAGPTHKWCLFP